MKIEFNEYNSMEEYYFDYGFNDDIEEIKDNEKPKINFNLFCYNNYDFVYITKFKEKLYYLDKGRFFISKDNHSEVEEGYYKFNYGDDIISKEELGVGFMELIEDDLSQKYIVLTCEKYANKIQQKFKEEASKIDKDNPYNVYWNSIGYLIDDNFIKNKLKGLSKDEVIKKIIEERKKMIDLKYKEEIDDLKKEVKENKKSQETKDVLNQPLINDEDFEIKGKYDNEKYKYISKEKKLIFEKEKNYDYKVKFIKEVKFKKPLKDVIGLNKDKSLNEEYVNKRDLSLWDLERLMFIWRLIESETSFDYKEVRIKIDNNIITNDKNEDDKEIVMDLKVDFEKALWNNIGVAKSKIPFIYNRFKTSSQEEQLTKYKCKKYISLLSKLSGVKVDVLDIKKINVNKRSNKGKENYEFDIEINLTNEKNVYNIKFMKQDLNLSWTKIRGFLVSGMGTTSNFTKTKFIQFCLALDIDKKVITDTINKVKILKQLNGG